MQLNIFFSISFLLFRVTIPGKYVYVCVVVLISLGEIDFVFEGVEGRAWLEITKTMIT